MSKKLQNELQDLTLNELLRRLADTKLQLVKKELRDTSVIRGIKRLIARKLTNIQKGLEAK